MEATVATICDTKRRKILLLVICSVIDVVIVAKPKKKACLTNPTWAGCGKSSNKQSPFGPQTL